MKEVSFRLDIREIFFTVRMVMDWNRLPREAVNGMGLVTKLRSSPAQAIAGFSEVRCVSPHASQCSRSRCGKMQGRHTE